MDSVVTSSQFRKPKTKINNIKLGERARSKNCSLKDCMASQNRVPSRAPLSTNTSDSPTISGPPDNLTEWPLSRQRSSPSSNGRVPSWSPGTLNWPRPRWTLCESPGTPWPCHAWQSWRILTLFRCSCMALSKSPRTGKPLKRNYYSKLWRKYRNISHMNLSGYCFRSSRAEW